MNTRTHFSEEDHQCFMNQGYLRLGCLLDGEALSALQHRIDAIMLGEISYPDMSFQLDGKSAEYRNLLPDSPGHKGATLAYRRITGLEQDPLFLAYIQHPLFRAITQRYIGEEVTIFRAMFMNKPAEQGTELPWHQDVGNGWGLDRDPIITIWTALDDATVANGCMQIVPRSHQLGVLNPQPLCLRSGPTSVCQSKGYYRSGSGGRRNNSPPQFSHAPLGYQPHKRVAACLERGLHGRGDRSSRWNNHIPTGFWVAGFIRGTIWARTIFLATHQAINLHLWGNSAKIGCALAF